MASAATVLVAMRWRVVMAMLLFRASVLGCTGGDLTAMSGAPPGRRCLNFALYYRLDPAWNVSEAPQAAILGPSPGGGAVCDVRAVDG